MPKKIDYDELKPIEDMNIHEKRRYAKYLGVKSPTTYAIAELDEAIRAQELQIGKLKDVRGVYEISPPEERAHLCDLINANARVTHNQKGYFVPFDEGDGVLRFETFVRLRGRDAYVPRAMVDYYKLRLGDEVLFDYHTLVYNKINIVRTLISINDVSLRSIAHYERFENLVSSAPIRPLSLATNNSVLNVMMRILKIGNGQSVGIVGDERLALETAYPLLVALYRNFRGEIMSIYDQGDAATVLRDLYNPFTCTSDESELNLQMLIATAKRHIEQGTSVAIVCTSKKAEVAKAVEKIAGNYNEACLTAFILCVPSDAKAVLTVRGGIVRLDESHNMYTATVAGLDAFKKIMRVKKNIRDGTPDEVLQNFIKEYNY